ncbi:uncharacterized protein LOC143035750 [Oratosquilla oratoria]|uniref:uncharacterized protein LOC143035750 n=1 Tax=Oratosquilla oratoria TaxID=337810 RepID=UPI003F76CC2E
MMSLKFLVNGMQAVLIKYPVSRGMATYLVLWPASNFLQQVMDGSREKFDLMEMIRYGLYGSCVNAPLIYKWIKIAQLIIPGKGLKSAVAKGYMDQLVFAPLNISQFFLGMSLLEGKPFVDSLQELSDKFVPTWMVSVSVWPIIQTVNFGWVAERNRVMVVSLGSFLWTIFLSYMHHTRPEDLPEELSNRRVHYDYKHGAQDVLDAFGHFVCSNKYDFWKAVDIASSPILPLAAKN